MEGYWKNFKKAEKICLPLRFNVLILGRIICRYSNAISCERGDWSVAKNDSKQRSMAMYETILKLKDLDECCRFFDDLCTPTELRSLEQRFDVAVYLQQGLVYLDILEKTGASSATISRVRRSMLDNGAGGVMREVILREGLHEKEEK